MVHEHFEEHKNQLFAGKKLKKHDRLPKGQKNTTRLFNLQKNTTQSFASHPSIVECCQQVALAWCYQQQAVFYYMNIYIY